MKIAKRASLLAACIAGHWILWLIYVNNIGWREQIAGALAALFAVIGMAVFAFKGHIQFQLRCKDLVQAVFLPWHVLDDTWKILQGVARQLFARDGAPSFIGAVPFDVGGDDPSAAGRRALAITYPSITPNFVVLGIVDDQRLMLYHQILPGKISTMTRNLGARP